ncbi:MAG: alpha/beta hydrolase [Pirellulales bacterium]
MLRIARGLLVAYLFVILIMLWQEDALLYFPARFPAGNWQPVAATFEDARFQSADGTQLHGWYFPRALPRATVLYLHGNAGNITQRIDVARRLSEDLNLAVLMFDYRGYGRSEGEPSEAGIVADARAARTWLAHRAGISEHDIVLMGRSLGGGVAVDLAARDGARGLILESTFTSLPDVAAAHFWWLPVRWLMRNRLDSATIIAGYDGPLLQSHGTADRTIPYEVGRQLFAAANEPKQFVDVPRGDHNDPQPDSFYRQFDDFIDKLQHVE